MLQLINKKKNLIITTAFLLAFFVFGGVVNAGVCEGLSDSACKALQGAASTASDAGIIESDTTAPKSIPVLIGEIVGVGLQFVGIAFLVLMIYGGITWMFARGNESEVQKAKDIIEASVFGLIIVLSAYAITAYVTSQLITATGL